VRGLATVVFLALVVVLCGLTPAAAAESPGDAYIRGYAAALLERDFKVSGTAVRVERGVVTINEKDLGPADAGRVKQTLETIPDVVRVDIAADAKPSRPPDDLRTGFLPGGHLFKPLIADPRWPHFGAAYQYYLDDPQLGSVGAVSFGETFTLYRGELGGGLWETGIQAGVFAVFDLEAESKDLINADYMVAAFLGYRYDQFSAIARLFHQSSHLGDEFILRNRTQNRINLSFEAVDLRLSYQFFGETLRLYGGGGYLFDQEPEDLKPGFVQAGVEFRSPWRWGPMRPIAAADVQNREENNWHTDFSLRAGVEFQNWLASRSLQILLEYFRGHSPNGQFYREKIDYLGIGAHFNF
jgi:hypothetical protein